MEKVLYEIKNGELSVTHLGDGDPSASFGSHYLSVSTMFEGILPMKISEKPVVLMDSFLNNLNMKEYNTYRSLINRLMNAVITAKSAEDLCDKSKNNSFYSTLMSTYKTYCKLNEKKPNPAALDDSVEYMATMARLSIRYFVQDFYDNLDSVKKIENVPAFDALKISNKRISTIKDSRLDEDQMLSSYITNLYSDGLKRLSFTTSGHKCAKCHWKHTYDCPKIAHMMIDDMTLEDEVLRDMITDATQLVTIKPDGYGGNKIETDYCIVRSCRRYGYFEQQYEKEHKDDESKYVEEQSSKNVKTLKRILTDKK